MLLLAVLLLLLLLNMDFSGMFSVTYLFLSSSKSKSYSLLAISSVHRYPLYWLTSDYFCFFRNKKNNWKQKQSKFFCFVTNNSTNDDESLAKTSDRSSEGSDLLKWSLICETDWIFSDIEICNCLRYATNNILGFQIALVHK